jgi:hypothetical protein
MDHAATGGRVSQERLDRVRELDVMVAAAEGETVPGDVGIGWLATGPVEGKAGRR